MYRYWHNRDIETIFVNKSIAQIRTVPKRSLTETTVEASLLLKNTIMWKKHWDRTYKRVMLLQCNIDLIFYLVLNMISQHSIKFLSYHCMNRYFGSRKSKLIICANFFYSIGVKLLYIIKNYPSKIILMSSDILTGDLKLFKLLI